MAGVSDCVEIRLLGRFSVRRSGDEVPPGAFGGRLVRTLIRVLLTRRGEFVAHDVLAEALWPGRMPADPVANLKVLVNRARAGLGDATLILTGPGGYSFAGGDVCRVDAEDFLTAVAEGQRHRRDGEAAFALRVLRSALDGWAGEPLAEDAYKDWARDYRTALSRAHLQALEDGAAAALALRDPSQAVVLAEAAVAREPLREAAHLVLAEAQAASGDLVAALRTIDALRRRLGDEVGLEPSAAVLDLERRLQRGDSVKPLVRRPAVRATGVAFERLDFVGREDELGAVLASIERSPPGVALVRGPAGAGKSRLLQEVASHSQLSVLAARAFQAEWEEPWSLARSVLREALALDLDVAGGLPERVAQALADVLPELEDVLPISAASIDSESRRALALEGAVRLIGMVAAKGVLLLLLDDVQWADPTSVLVVGLVARRVPSAALVLGYRPAEVAPDSPLAAFVDDVAAEREVSEVQVGALPVGTLTQLIADAELSEAIARGTDCTPLAVAEVVRRLAAEGAIEPDTDGRWQPRRPDVARLAEDIARAGQRQNIERRAARQPPGRRETLSMLALLGRETPARLLAAARGVDQSTVLDDLDGLARTGLTRLGDGGWATAHDLIGEAVADALTREERGRLHHAVAQALLGTEGDAAEVARHLAGAGDRPAAATAFARAAAQRMERYAGDEARALADAGHALKPSGSVLVSLLETRAEARALRGDPEGARSDLREALAEIRTPVGRSRVLSKLSLLTSSKDAAESIAFAEAAVAEAANDAGARAEALVAAAFAAANSEPDRAERLVVEARHLFEQVGDARGLASTVDVQANALFFARRLSEAVALYRRAARLYRDSGQLTKVGTPMLLEAWCLHFMGRQQEAQVVCDEAIEVERSLGQLEGEAGCLKMSADIAFASGRIDEACRRLAIALPVCRSVGSRELISGALLLSGRLSEAASDFEAAEACFKEALEAAGDLLFHSSTAVACLASLRLMLGDVSEAEMFATQASSADVGPGPLEGRLILAEIALLRGDPGAEAQAREALRRADTTDFAPSANRIRLERLVGTEPPPAGGSRQRKAFMFTDIVASSNLVEILGDEAWDHLLRWHDQALRDIFVAHAGEEVNRMGDGFFVAFDRVEAAIRCAVAVQQALARQRREQGFAPDVRIGIHEAEATRQDGDYQGRGVHQAARIGGAASAGEILVSEAALGDLGGFRCSPPHPITLKGFSEPVPVVSVEWR
jgi:class 3 adenylate cyclase/DNA-binding SARP family transcriptional activator